MKSIYLSPDREHMVLHDDERNLYIIMERQGESLTKDEADAVRQSSKRATRAGNKCSKCRMPGHKATTCNQQADDDDIEDDELGEDEDDDVPAVKPKNAEQLKETIEEMKAKGLNSVQIAKKLNLSLALVNRYW